MNAELKRNLKKLNVINILLKISMEKLHTNMVFGLFTVVSIWYFIVHMNYIIEGEGALVNPSEKHQYRSKSDQPFMMICGAPKKFE